MTALDLGPATRATAALVAGVRDDQLGDPTPCPAYSVADLLDHLGGLSVAFTQAALKDTPEGGHEPSADGSRLEPEFRDRIGAALSGLAEAWRAPGAFDGMTMAGPIELPADVAALVALNEVVVHGWDLARATGQPYDPDADSVQACLGFATSFEAPADAGEGPFGPPVDVPSDAPVLDRLVGATGRRPDWPA
jgi:uncharacterized protein (TIGR03086 family)